MRPRPSAPPPDRWPLPPLLLWAAAWAGFIGLRLGLQRPPAEAFVMAALLAAVWAFRRGTTPARRLIMALGFPLSWVLASGMLPLPPAWVWALGAVALLLLYPWRTWRDAPLFPTPADALNDLPGLAPLPPGARVLDAGCGLGHGLEALRQAYPLASLAGVESSRLLAWACARRCPWAQVAAGDLWQADWSAVELVYLFQRPETMPRAADKARAELRDDAWLVSLEFPIEGVAPAFRLMAPDGRPVWGYRGAGLRAGASAVR